MHLLHYYRVYVATRLCSDIFQNLFSFKYINQIDFILRFSMHRCKETFLNWYISWSKVVLIVSPPVVIIDVVSNPIQITLDASKHIGKSFRWAVIKKPWHDTAKKISAIYFAHQWTARVALEINEYTNRLVIMCRPWDPGSSITMVDLFREETW